MAKHLAKLVSMLTPKRRWAQFSLMTALAELWGFRTRAALRAGKLLEANWLAVTEMAGQLLREGSIRGR